MKPVSFVKVVGTGNDFILVDGRSQSLKSALPALAKSWCDRQRGIGGDGLLVIGPSKKADARMRIFNSDGSEATMCGNGLGCVGWDLHSKDHGKKTLTVETEAGVMAVRVTGTERVRIDLPAPAKIQLGLFLFHKGTHIRLHAVNTGVPHAVYLVPRCDSVDLASLGPVIRHHRLFQPAGTNVNIAQIDSPHQVQLRTYERGVEGETLACGTGAVAAVVVGAALKKLESPVQVKTRSGETLTVGFSRSGETFDRLTLEGPARICFEGVMAR